MRKNINEQKSKKIKSSKSIKKSFISKKFKANHFLKHILELIIKKLKRKKIINLNKTIKMTLVYLLLFLEKLKIKIFKKNIKQINRKIIVHF